MTKPPCKIALQICWNAWFEHEMVRGIREFALSRPHWVIRNMGEQLPAARWWRWSPAAAIVSVLPAGFAKRAWGLTGPLVALKATAAADVSIERDNVAIGRLAAQHLVDQGYRRLAFVPAQGWPFSGDREAGFVEVARAHGVPVTVLTSEAADIVEWSPDSPLHAWLRALAKPCGLGCATDWLARAVMDACRFGGIAVPEDIAIVGVDNDEPTCTLSDPPLSSVAIPWQRVGFEAARWVDRLLAGKKPPRDKLVRVPPAGVVVRRSSDLLAVPDPVLRQAVAFIRQQACAGVVVKEVAAAVRVDRRTLERSFRHHLARSPHEEIRRVQLEAAKRLLAETDLPLGEVCRTTGLSRAYFGTNFKRVTGQTPNAFRAAHRRR